MAHSLSAQKRIRQTAKARLRNRDRKKAVRTQIKKLDAAVSKGDVTGSETELRATAKLLDRTSTRGTIHPKTAARRKSRLAKRLNALKAKG